MCRKLCARLRVAYVYEFRSVNLHQATENKSKKEGVLMIRWRYTNSKDRHKTHKNHCKSWLFHCEILFIEISSETTNYFTFSRISKFIFFCWFFRLKVNAMNALVCRNKRTSMSLPFRRSQDLWFFLFSAANENETFGPFNFDCVDLVVTRRMSGGRKKAHKIHCIEFMW